MNFIIFNNNNHSQPYNMEHVTVKQSKSVWQSHVITVKRCHGIDIMKSSQKRFKAWSLKYCSWLLFTVSDVIARIIWLFLPSYCSRFLMLVMSLCVRCYSDLICVVEYARRLISKASELEGTWFVSFFYSFCSQQTETKRVFPAYTTTTTITAARHT